jgi:hypothetical protein
VGPRAAEWVGPRTGDLVGPRTGDWVGLRAAEWVGPRAGDWVGPRAGDWVGPRTGLVEAECRELKTTIGGKCRTSFCGVSRQWLQNSGFVANCGEKKKKKLYVFLKLN